MSQESTPASKPELNDAETEILRIIMAGAEATPAVILEHEGRLTVVPSSTIAKLREAGLITNHKSDPCQPQAIAELPHATAIEAWACEHGTVHFELRDPEGKPFAIALLSFPAFENLVDSVCNEMEAHVMARHAAPADATKH